MKKIFVFFTTILFSLSLFAQTKNSALGESAKTVKVGYLISDSKFMSGAGINEQKDGYAYEYLQQLSSYTGWKYEYVYGYFSDLCDMLAQGKIDLMPDISYTKERAEVMNFPNYDMGEETYYLYSKTSQTYFSTKNDFSFLKGKKVGINKKTYQYDLFYAWKEKNNVDCIVYEYDFNENAGNLLDKGQIDYYLEVDYVANDNWFPVVKIGASKFYLALNKNRTDLLEEINVALSELYSLNPYYNHVLWNKHYLHDKIISKLTPREERWFETHNYTLNIGLLKNDIPFAFQEKGINKGVIIDFVQYLKTVFDLENLVVNYHYFNDYFELNNALKEGVVDTGFPFMYDHFAAESFGTIISNPIATIPMACVVRKDRTDTDVFSVSAKKGSLDAFYSNLYYPNKEHHVYDNDEDCFLSVISGTSDKAISNVYKIQNYLYGRKKYEILTTDSHPSWELCFAFVPENFILCNVTNRLFASIEKGDVSNVIEKYAVTVQKYTIQDFFDDYLIYIFMVITVISLLFITLFFSIDKLIKYSSYDELTRLISRKKLPYFYSKVQKSIAVTQEKMSFILFDIDDFKFINDFYGHNCGDKVIKHIANVISRGINDKDYAFRSAGDEFLVLALCDYEGSLKIAERIRRSVENQIIEYNNTKIKVTVSVGVIEYKENILFDDLFFKAKELLNNAKDDGKNIVKGKSPEVESLKNK